MIVIFMAQLHPTRDDAGPAGVNLAYQAIND